MVPRILCSILLLLSVLFMPLWLSFIVALGLMLYFPFFFEAVVLFLLSDLLYGAGEARFFHIVFISTILSTAALALVELLKKKTKFYPS